MPSVSRVGSLRNKITIQNNVLSGDTFGGYSTANTTFLTAFAQIKPKSAKQIFNESTGERVQNPHTFEFLIRYRSGITTTMRILFGSRTFDIVKINNENDYNNFITLTAIENVGT